MSRLVTLPVGQRPRPRVIDPKVMRSEAADEKRQEPCRGCSEHPGRELHHLVPRGRGGGGDDVLENLVGLCDRCHVRLHGLGSSLRVRLSIGEALRDDEILYVLERKGAAWLERTYGVEVLADA